MAKSLAQSRLAAFFEELSPEEQEIAVELVEVLWRRRARLADAVSRRRELEQKGDALTKEEWQERRDLSRQIHAGRMSGAKPPSEDEFHLPSFTPDELRGGRQPEGRLREGEDLHGGQEIGFKGERSRRKPGDAPDDHLPSGEPGGSAQAQLPVIVRGDPEGETPEQTEPATPPPAEGAGQKKPRSRRSRPKP